MFIPTWAAWIIIYLITRMFFNSQWFTSKMENSVICYFIGVLYMLWTFVFAIVYTYYVIKTIL